MSNSAYDEHGVTESRSPHSGIRTITQWLESPMAPLPADELPSLRAHVKALGEVGGTAKQRAYALDGLYKRSSTVLERLLPELTDLALPIPRKTRRLVRSVLDLLQILADDTLALLDGQDAPHSSDPSQAPDLALWRSLQALAQQLMISHLIAAPAPAGAWQQLHQTYATAQRLQLATSIPRGQASNLQHVYQAALLLGCAQPASLTAREVLFLAAYFERFAGQVEAIPTTAAVGPGTFWIDPARDLPALASSRKQAQSASPFECFSCARLALLLKTQIAQLNAGTPPPQISLPDFAGTPAGVGVLRRLAGRWSEPAKRRFQRRRQNYRTVLSTGGIDELWQLCKNGNAASVELSSWMITNESPDGYSVMHVSGKVGALSIGDVTAVRSGDEQNWQICMVRWAVSENPEHLELGLQILAPRAVPALLAQPSENQHTEHLRVLVLPEIPMLRSSQLLVVASGALTTKDKKLVLIIEEQNLAVREIKSICIDEQTGSVEILSIEPDQKDF